MVKTADPKDLLDEAVDAVLDGIPDVARDAAAHVSDAASVASGTTSRRPRRTEFLVFLVVVGVFIAWLWSRP